MDPNEEVRTIFILGFPTDVKERELQNLLRWWPGYEASQMNFKGEQPMGFALFSTVEFAMSARDALQNLVFDSEKNSVLRAEMAKKNLFVKKGIVGTSTEATQYYDSSKRMRTDYSASYGQPSPYFSTPGWTPQSFNPPPPPTYDHYPGYSVAPAAPVAIHSSYSTSSNKDNPPCNTLFIGNLGENTLEAEVRNLFASQPGYKQMKLLRQGKSTICFVEMQDIPAAVNVHATMQGAVLTSSDRGGIRIQFSKNQFGKKRDSSSQDHHPQLSNLSSMSHSQLQNQSDDGSNPHLNDSGNYTPLEPLPPVKAEL